MTAPRAFWREATNWIEKFVKPIEESFRSVPITMPAQFPELDLSTLLAEAEGKKLLETLDELAKPSEVNSIASYGGDAIVKSP